MTERRPYEITPLLYQWGEFRACDGWSQADFDFTFRAHHFFEDDGEAGVSEQQFWMLYGIAMALQMSGLKVCMMCQAGENRSGLMSVMYLHYAGMSVEDAIALVRAKVPVLSVGQPHVLWNPAFERQLRERLK